MSLSNIIKNLRNTMRQDAGISGDAQRIEQLAWLLFIKIYSDLEIETELEDSNYKSPIPNYLRWNSWASEKALGKNAPTGEELLNFVNGKLFPELKELNIADLTGQAFERGTLLISVFSGTYNFMKNGTLLRQIINKIDEEIDFNQIETRHLFGDIYEEILKELQSAGDAGEFYTPRAVTQFAVDMIDPKLGEVVLDPACGTGGFLTATFEAMKTQVKSPDELRILKNNIKGVEKKPLPHVLCATNMMIHGIEVPSNIRSDNTLTRPLRDYGEKDQVDIIVTNPPFGGTEEPGVENNFPAEFKTRETADLFLVLVIELLKKNGRAAVILPDSTLFGDGIKARIKKRLLEECNLHTIVRLPHKVFAPYTDIKTNILFLTKGVPTKEVWYYEHPYPEGVKSYTKTKPMKISEFSEEKKWWNNRTENDFAWKVPIEEIIQSGFNLDIKNPNAPEFEHQSSDELFLKYESALAEVKLAQDNLKKHLESLLK